MSIIATQNILGGNADAPRPTDPSTLAVDYAFKGAWASWPERPTPSSTPAAATHRRGGEPRWRSPTSYAPTLNIADILGEEVTDPPATGAPAPGNSINDEPANTEEGQADVELPADSSYSDTTDNASPEDATVLTQVADAIGNGTVGGYAADLNTTSHNTGGSAADATANASFNHLDDYNINHSTGNVNMLSDISINDEPANVPAADVVAVSTNNSVNTLDEPANTAAGQDEVKSPAADPPVQMGMGESTGVASKSSGAAHTYKTSNITPYQRFQARKAARLAKARAGM